MCAGKLPLSNAFHYNAHTHTQNKNQSLILTYYNTGGLTFIIKF